MTRKKYFRYWNTKREATAWANYIMGIVMLVGLVTLIVFSWIALMSK